jgi:hypothetical protein
MTPALRTLHAAWAIALKEDSDDAAVFALLPT